MHQIHSESSCHSLKDERTQRVANSFDQAAQDYLENAHVQRQAAESLAQCILENAAPETTNKILELGCGPGLLTEQLLKSYLNSHWTITDIAPQMVDLCRRRVLGIEAHPQCDFLTMDAQEVTTPGPFDLICSNLTFQWLSDPAATVNSLIERLAPGGLLIFNTLGTETFSYWQELDAKIEGARTAPVFQSLDELKNELATVCLVSDCTLLLYSESIEDQHPSFLKFLNSLKAIGAHIPVGDASVPLSQLRNVIRASAEEMEKNQNESVSLNYQVISVVIKKS